MTLYQQIQECIAFIKQRAKTEPRVGIILGTGLGGLAQEIEVEHEFPYEQITNFPVSTVEGHSGKLILGNLAGKRVIAMQGRFHYYEGYTMREVVFPVRVMKVLGIKRLIVDISNNMGGNIVCGNAITAAMFPTAEYKWFQRVTDAPRNDQMRIFR